MKNNPLVSVVMPIYNGMFWAKEAISSILNQTYQNIELIIVDDASTDGLRDYVIQINDFRVKYISFPTNQGIVAALNYGISVSQGKYIARMDADDISNLTRIEKQVSFFENHPDYGMCATDITTFTHSKNITKQQLDKFQEWYNHAHTYEEIKKQLPIGNCLNHPSVMFRKEVLQTLRYRENYKYAEDYDLFIRVAKQTKIIKLSEKLLHYRVHSSQISTKFEQRQREIDALIKTDLLLHDYCNKQDRIIIWGAGLGGRLLAKSMKQRGMNLVGFVDKAERKWGTIIEGYSILGGENVLRAIEFDFVVISTTLGRDDALDFLNKSGYKSNQYLAVW